MTHRAAILISIVPVVLALTGANTLADQTRQAAPAEPTKAADGFKPPEGLKTGWYARIETEKGRVLVRLAPRQAPQAVSHFVALAEGRLEWNDPITGETIKVPYYDGTRVYRAWAGARIQAGDRTREGRNAPMMFVSPTENLGPLNFYGAGRLGLARGAGGLINPTRFLLTYAAQPKLHGYQPCIGEIIEGREVVFQLSTIKTSEGGLPIDPPVIEAVRIFKIGDPQPLVEPVPHFPEREAISVRDPDEKP